MGEAPAILKSIEDGCGEANSDEENVQRSTLNTERSNG
jgi:hypothetical protein